MIPSLRRLVLGTAGVMAMTVPALAHAHLKAATPAVNARVHEAPTELDLTFSEGVNLKFTGVTVTGPDQAPVATGPASLGAGGDTLLVVPLTPPLAAGVYTVAWHALASDGHRSSGSYRFTVAP